MPVVAALRASAPDSPPLLLCIDRRQTAEILPLLALLPHSEQARYRAFRTADDRERFLLGRAMLRRLLGCWRRELPDAVPVVPGVHGKPACPGGPDFNLSHSGALILLALHPHRAVGVDVEAPNPDVEWESIARQWLGAAAISRLRMLAPTERSAAFLSAWCEYEAEGKAHGTGIAPVHPSDAERPRLRRWCLELPDGYVGAVAMVASESDPSLHRSRVHRG